MARRKEIFKAEVAHALEDGEVSATEEEHLEDLAKRYDISEEHAKAILELAKEHRKSE
jgi:voltage-gated potassium channel